ncbi:hypothetical protein GS421_17760 [Rhodococcus hoagii]|nr:hypothetical protein [Prescottella equi]
MVSPPCSTLSRRPKPQHHGSFRRQRGFSNSSASGAIRHRDHPGRPGRPDHHDAHRACNHGQGHGATTSPPPSPPPNASGSVQFLDGQTPIGGPATVTNGTASVQHSFATSGNHSIGAVFTAGAGFLGSTATASRSW